MLKVYVAEREHFCHEEVAPLTELAEDLAFGIIERHPEAGYEILADVELPWPVAKSSCSTTNARTVAANPGA